MQTLSGWTIPTLPARQGAAKIQPPETVDHAENDPAARYSRLKVPPERIRPDPRKLLQKPDSGDAPLVPDQVVEITSPAHPDQLFTMISRPTELQARVFELLGIKPSVYVAM